MTLIGSNVVCRWRLRQLDSLEELVVLCLGSCEEFCCVP